MRRGCGCPFPERPLARVAGEPIPPEPSRGAAGALAGALARPWGEAPAEVSRGAWRAWLRKQAQANALRVFFVPSARALGRGPRHRRGGQPGPRPGRRIPRAHLLQWLAAGEQQQSKLDPQQPSRQRMADAAVRTPEAPYCHTTAAPHTATHPARPLSGSLENTPKSYPNPLSAPKGFGNLAHNNNTENNVTVFLCLQHSGARQEMGMIPFSLLDRNHLIIATDRH